MRPMVCPAKLQQSERSKVLTMRKQVEQHRKQLISVALLKCGSVVHVLAPDFVELRPAILFMQASNDKLLTRQLLEGYVAAVQITQQ